MQPYFPKPILKAETKQRILFSLGILFLDIAIDYILAFPFAVHYLGNYQFTISNGWYWQLATDGAWWSSTTFFSNYIIQYLFVYLIIPGLFCIAGLLLVKVSKTKLLRILLLYIGLSVMLNLLLPVTLFESMRITLPPLVNLFIIFIFQYLFWYLLLYFSQSGEIKTRYMFIAGVILINYVTILIFTFPKSIQFLGDFQFSLSNAWFWEFSLDGNFFYYLSPLITNSFLLYTIIYLILPIAFFIPGQLLMGSPLKATLKNYLLWCLPLTLFINLLLAFFVLPSIAMVVPPLVLWMIFLSINIVAWKIRVKERVPRRTIILI
jgi:hypothetical protein